MSALPMWDICYGSPLESKLGDFRLIKMLSAASSEYENHRIARRERACLPQTVVARVVPTATYFSGRWRKV